MASILKNHMKGRDNMRLISNAKHGEPVESGSIFRAEIGTMTISIHRYRGCEGWFLSCRDLGIDSRELKSQGLMQAVKESRKILKNIADEMQENINTFCNSDIVIARY